MSLENVLVAWGGSEVDAMTVYTDMFRLGQNQIQKNGETAGLYKANPIGYWKNYDESKGHYRIMFDDDFERTLSEMQQADFAILNGITYFGRKNLQEHASKMYAMIFDIDDVTDKTLNAFLSGAYRAKVYPIPNYIILSGHGVHLYYIFEEPISLYPNLKLQLKELKYALIERMWNAYTSTNEKKQFQGINQGFRPIGGKTKIDGVRVRAYQMHRKPFSIKQLEECLPTEHHIDESKLWEESKYTLAEAKEKFPQWYERRVLQRQSKRHWVCKVDLYEWWKRQIMEEATFHHRYFCIMALAIYGSKCGVDFKTVKQDAFEFIPFLNEINPSEPFTENDVISALECYDERYMTFPKNDIAKLTGIQIPTNKRNYRKQQIHLERARAVQNIDYPNGEWRNKDGRPSKQMIVNEWQQQNPEGRKADCIRETGLSKNTVYKWWK